MVLPHAIEWTGSMSVRDAVFTSGIFPKITFNSIAKGPEWPAKVTKECKARANRQNVEGNDMMTLQMLQQQKEQRHKCIIEDVIYEAYMFGLRIMKRLQL